ncbi:MAG TPA: HlyD family efflux transporter periplasmic adaptor subunit [Thermoanaerobaculia bacterium]
MDIVRTQPYPKKLSRTVYAVIGGIAVVVITILLARLKPAAPPVSRGSVVIDEVKRGPLTREVRGSGVLTPEEVRWIPATTDGRIERVLIQPGSAVTADSIILELSDPAQQQVARDAEWQLRAANADFETMRAELENERLDREAALARLRAEAEQARLRAEADAELERNGLVAGITRKMSQSTAAELARRVTLEEQRLRVSVGSRSSRLAAQQAAVEQRRSLYDLQQQRVRSLQVRAGIDGVLQQIAVQPGQRVTAGTNLARVARPDRLKAEIRIAETQAKDIAVGQPAKIDTRNGIVEARVSRIDPAVTQGTVIVDLTIVGPLPAGARPDTSVDATIELERMADVIHVGRPVSAQEGQRGYAFAVEGDGAVRVPVEYGRASATAIEIRSGLKPGQQIIVSDTSAFEKYDQIKLN